MNRVAKERALLKRASDRLSGLTTGRMGLSSAGGVEPDVDAREAGPGPVSRLRGANPSGRDGVLELRGLCHRRSRRPAQPSLRARPREGAETLRGGVPSHETTEGPRSESGPRDGRGGTPLHLHELWELRRLGRREVPPLRGGIRAGTRRDHAGGRGHPRHPPLPRLRRGLRPGNRRVRSVRGGVEGNRKTGDCCTERGPRRSARRRGRASRDGTRQSRRLPERVRSAGHGDAATRGRAARRNATGAPAPHPHAKASGADSERAAPTATEIYTRSGPRRAETRGNARADASSASNENQASIAPTADACGSRAPQARGPQKTAPVSVRETIAVLSAPKTRKRTQRSSRMASGKVRRKPPATRRISAETAGSLVVAAAASLLLAGALGQRLGSAGIATFLVGLISFVTGEHLRGRGHWPGRLDGVLLIAGIVLGLAVWPVGRVAPGPTAAVGVAVSAAIPLALATRRLQKSPPRILLAIAAGIPLVR